MDCLDFLYNSAACRHLLQILLRTVASGFFRGCKPLCLRSDHGPKSTQQAKCLHPKANVLDRAHVSIRPLLPALFADKPLPFVSVLPLPALTTLTWKYMNNGHQCYFMFIYSFISLEIFWCQLTPSLLLFFPAFLFLSQLFGFWVFPCLAGSVGVGDWKFFHRIHRNPPAKHPPAVALQTERSHDPAHHAISIPANKMENNFKMFHSIRGKKDANMKNIGQSRLTKYIGFWNVLKCFEFCKTKHDRKTKQKGQLLEPRNKLCSHWRRRPSFLRCLRLCFCVRCHCFPTWKVPVI